MNLSHDPLIPILEPGPKEVCSWPKFEIDLPSRTIIYVPLSEALTRRWPLDAHASAYSVPSKLRRLCTDPPAYKRLPDGVPMVVWLWDFDCAAAHKAMGGSSSASATDAWWAEQLPRFRALLRAYPGGFIYRTRGGARIVYRLPVPLVVREGADEIRWTRSYLSALAMLARRFGIVCDPSIADWPRAIRLPHTVREGVPQEYETIGDPHRIAAFEYLPTPAEEAADLDHVRRLALRDPRWRPKLRYLAGNALAPARVRAPRPARAVTSEAIDAGVLSHLAEDLGRAIAAMPGGRHQVHMALAGACYDRGVPLDAGPDLARAICAHSGETDDRPQVWETTASKVRSGGGYSGFGALAQHWPELARLVDAALPTEGGARTARDELDARGVPAEIPAGDVQAIVCAALRGAPLGLSVLRVTEGAGKTRGAAVVLRERARAAARYERVPSTLKTVYVAPTHAVAAAVAEQLAGERAEYWRGVLSVRDSAGSPACRHHLPVLSLTGAGHSARTFCEGCEHDKDCDAQRGAIVPLHPEAPPPAVVVTVHAYLAEALEWAGESALVIVDEDPETVRAASVSRAELEGAAAAEDLFARGERFRAPVLRALAAGLERGELLQGEALREVFARGCDAMSRDTGWHVALLDAFGTDRPDEVLTTYAWRSVWAEHSPEPGTVTLRRRASWAPRPSSEQRQRVLRRAHDGRLVPASETHAIIAQLAAGVVRAPSPDGRVHDERSVSALEVDHRDPSRRVLRAVLASAAVARAASRLAPTVLLDATADGAMLDTIARAQVPVTDVRVADGAPVLRRLLYWSQASRSSALADGRVRWDSGLARYLGAALTQACALTPAPHVAIFTWKALADVLRAGSDPTACELLAIVTRAGGRVSIGHYGHARGRDDWMDADALVSIGDPRPNLGATRAIAAACGLAADHDRVYRHATAAELSQVGGRLRAPWRTRPALHLHVGQVPALRWDARAEVLELPRGPTDAWDPAAVAMAVRVCGSQRLAAAALGTSQQRVSEIARKPIAFAQSQATPSNTIKNLSVALGVGCDSANSLENHPKSPQTWDSGVVRELVEALGGAVKAAAALGVSKALLYHWLKGTRPTPIEHLRRMRELTTPTEPTPVVLRPMRFVAREVFDDE